MQNYVVIIAHKAEGAHNSSIQTSSVLRFVSHVSDVTRLNEASVTESPILHQARHFQKFCSQLVWGDFDDALFLCSVQLQEIEFADIVVAIDVHCVRRHRPNDGIVGGGDTRRSCHNDNLSMRHRMLRTPRVEERRVGVFLIWDYEDVQGQIIQVLFPNVKRFEGFGVGPAFTFDDIGTEGCGQTSWSRWEHAAAHKRKSSTWMHGAVHENKNKGIRRQEQLSKSTRAFEPSSQKVFCIL